MTELKRLMLALEVALLDKAPEEVTRQYHHYPDTVLEWIEEQPGGNNPIWYFADGGYSRLCWDPYGKQIFLTYNSRKQVFDRWENAIAAREALLNFLTAEYERLRKEKV